MKSWKRGSAAALSALLLISALPVTALAEEREEEQPCDEVVYNLGDLEVTVGSDAERAEAAETPYDLFSEDGSYTLTLEPDAFFPYEVQFTCGGETDTHWFMDAEDTVEVGGHVFSVESAVSDPNALTSLSFEIAGRTVTAYPEEKEFTNEGPSMALVSLMPLKEYSMTLDMTGLLPDELKAVKVSAVLSGMRNYSDTPPAIQPDDVVIWSRGSGSDDFTRAEQDGTMDLSYENYDDRSTVELIVGSGQQLDLSSTRYHLDVQLTPAYEPFTAKVRAADGQAMNLYNTDFFTSGNKFVLQLTVDKNQWQSGQEACLSLSLSDQFDRTGLTAAVYRGYYDTEEAAIAAGAEEIASQIWDADPGYKADYSYQKKFEGMPEVTVVLKRNGQTALIKPVVLYLRASEISMDYYLPDLYAEDGHGGYTDVIVRGYGASSISWDRALGMDVYSIILKSGYDVNNNYYLRMRMHNDAAPDSNRDNGIENVKHAALGNFKTAEAICAQPDIKTDLFGAPGYMADYSKGVIFSVLDIEGGIHRVKIIAAKTMPEELPSAPQPDFVDTYFRMQSADAVTENGAEDLSCYVMPYAHDGYYYNGYQTVFLLNKDGTPVDAQKIVPIFYTGDHVTMYAGLDHASGVEQKSGETAIAFRNGETIQYSAAAGSNVYLKNYWVTFLTQQTGGPKLFVNAANDPDRLDKETGLPLREVYLTEDYNYHHDVFFANIGDQDMKNVYVQLKDAENVVLDEYWTIREDAADANRTLSAFDSVRDTAPDGSTVSDGNLANVAKVRLVPVEKNSVGKISGTLVIGYDNGEGKAEKVEIKLTGISGSPKITTDTLAGGVKYVPYNSVIMTNSMGASDAIAFSVTSGALPTGVKLYPNGKLYGMPTRAGTYTFTAAAVYNGDKNLSDSKTFTIVIKDNTNTNVDASTDPGYEVLDRLPDTMTSYTDQVFRSNGAFGYFYKFYLDGRELTLGRDYTAEEGSTKITIQAQTFRNSGSGTHTIAAEFRTDKDDSNTVKTAAQNYTIPGSGSSGGGSDSDDSGSSKPAVKPTTPVTPSAPTAADVFQDITAQAWYYADVDWAYQNELMIGVSGDRYAPSGLISPSTVVTVLARMDGVDLSRYAGASYPGVALGQWYTNAAVWAGQTGLLPEDGFPASSPITRAKLAVMLVKYLRSKGIDCTLTGEPVAFTDAAMMTQEENDAFQILYQFGIFKGIGNYTMNVAGATTRAQMAVLAHRLSVFMESHKK